MEETSYPELQDNIQALQPFMTLWETSDLFMTKSDSWLQSLFKELDPEAMAEEIDGMWRLLHKSVKTFNDVPPPRRVAEMIKTRIDKFNKDMPIITALGSKGMRSRHWDAIEEIVGTDIRIGLRPLSSVFLVIYFTFFDLLSFFDSNSSLYVPF